MTPFDLDTRIAGIPCTIRVTHYNHVAPWKGSAWTCESDIDYYGYTEVEFDILDRKGYRAKWLEKKLTTKDRDRIESEIKKVMKDG